jgi:hypothetical protein
MNYYEKYVKAYNQTPKGKYIRQRANAKRRGIPWEFTFDTWWDVWEKSGKWEQRGKEANQYVMSRVHDDGPYSPGNVKVITMSANSKFAIRHGLHLDRNV